MEKINVLDQQVAIAPIGGIDYINITDMARYRDEERTNYVLQNWLRNRDTVEFLGIWEHLNNPAFNSEAFEGFRRQAGLNRFSLTARQWIDATQAVGLVIRGGRYAGIYAHPDIAFEFAAWVAVEFKLYLIKEFQRLKEGERDQLGWDVGRNLTKINYRIHTDAIQQNLIPPEVTPQQASLVYASEADLLNVALFGKTAREWRDGQPGSKGNIRDEANVAQLVCLANLEALNAHLIHQGVAQSQRLKLLNQTAIQQMKVLTTDSGVRRLEAKNKP